MDWQIPTNSLTRDLTVLPIILSLTFSATFFNWSTEMSATKSLPGAPDPFSKFISFLINSGVLSLLSPLYQQLLLSQGLM